MLLFAWLLLGSAAALPSLLPKRSVSVASSMIQTIAPASASCDGEPRAGECRTATQAADPISQSFATYGIATPGEAAALISLMAFESADFKYQNNYYPGRPGQGTRNMQMINFNVLYAQSIPELTDKVNALTGGMGGASLGPDQANAVRALLTSNDAYDFGSAAWFLTTQCTADIRSQVQSGTLAGWQQYMSSCVGTPATDDRQLYWSRAIGALSQ